MKLDKIRFAGICVLIQGWFDDRKQLLSSFDIETLDRIIDFEVPVAEKQYVDAALVDELLKQMLLGNKIPAIKAYHDICHAGLKESKDAVEKYWVKSVVVKD